MSNASFDPEAARAQRSQPLAVSLWLSAVVAAASFGLSAIQVLAPEVARDASLPIAFVGWYTATAWLSTIFSSTATGTLIPRHGAWRLTQACVLLCALGLALAATGSPLGLALGAVLIGLGHGLEGPASSQLLVQHVPAARRPLLFSVKQAGVQLGAVAASALLPIVALHLGWRAACAVVVGLLLVGVVLLRQPGHRYPPPPATEAVRIGARESLNRLARSPELRRLSITAATYAATQVCLSSFFVTWAVKARGVTLVEAGQWLAAAQAGGLVGRILWGWVASRLGQSTALLRTLGLVMTGCALVLGLLGAGLPGALLWPLLTLFGLSASGWNGVFLAEIARRVPTAQAGSATGAVMVVMTFGLVAGPLVFGGLAALTSLTTAFALLALVSFTGAWVLPRG